MKVAIIHDWLVTYTGAEKVLEQLLLLFPEADLYSIVDFLPPEQRAFIQDKPVHTTFIQKIPLAKKYYRHFLPLMPLAIERLDMSSYDLVISSSHAVAKGIITGPDQTHICYIHSPIRYAWDLQHQYLKESNLNKGFKSLIVTEMLHRMRQWDLRTQNGVDHFIANSQFIARRVWKVYRRKASVIYPPVDTTSFTYSADKEDYYLTASRFVPYKKIDVIVEAFNRMPDKKLVIIGTGPDFKKIKDIANSNISLLGYQPFDVLHEHMKKAKAFVFAAEEDFGIVPVEAQACGTPVIAFGKGGALETVVGLEKSNPTGVFFYDQTPDSIQKAVTEFEQAGSRILPENCRKNSLNFSVERFRSQITKFIENNANQDDGEIEFKSSYEKMLV
ncbi:glycosyltransferase family 4 protein [Paenibacillus beijingensis]|uniref:Glycosyl transferase family 1 n=1 Tax=Paenibacillus beijingensis TaxID=1126833 RepID=A0A0D5NF09_9BACL|nr:glycosyltransferase family 4 protein [Paenibacillus beijingensis]AJY73974.1 glycosyl transferase family 1 [Paenibacillus beijingensis]